VSAEEQAQQYEEAFSKIKKASGIEVNRSCVFCVSVFVFPFFSLYHIGLFEATHASGCQQDTDRLVTRFIQVEDQNFALFNYVNALSNEIETIQEKVCSAAIVFVPRCTCLLPPSPFFLLPSSFFLLPSSFVFIPLILAVYRSQTPS
jgi:hypothetical protein